jgi:uncharacterized phage protein (TIGR01671 family)
MREIKFRAWDGSHMIYRGLYDRNWYTDEKGGKAVRSIHPRDINDLKVMEYTGLKDVNGKEIYEGDILSFTTQRKNGFPEDDKKVILKPVEFGEFCYGNNVLGDFIGFHIDGSSIKYKLTHGCEIIGNIYENPNLLK